MWYTILLENNFILIQFSDKCKVVAPIMVDSVIRKILGQGQKIIIFIFVSLSYVSGLQKYNTFVYWTFFMNSLYCVHMPSVVFTWV
jgi:hypothetical protein